MRAAPSDPHPRWDRAILVGFAVALLVVACGTGGTGNGGPQGPAPSPTPGVPIPGVPGTAGDGSIEARLEEIRARHGLPALTAMTFRGTTGPIEIGAVGVRAVGYGEPVTRDDVWHVGSLTKSMTSTLAGVLVEQGRIDWETTVSEVFPDLAARFRPEYATVRLDELVTHTAGLVVDMSRAPSWGALRSSRDSLRSQRRRLVAEYLALPPDSPRGTGSYSNAGYVVGGAMLEEVTGEAWEDLMRHWVFGPLGMRTAGFGAPGSPGVRNEPWGHVSAAGGFEPLPPGPNADNPLAIGPAGTVHASLADLSVYYRLHIEGDLGRGTFLSPETFVRLHRAAPGTDYAYGWGVDQRDWSRGRVLTHAGSNGWWYARVLLAPNRDVGFFAATNAGDNVASDTIDETMTLLVDRFIAAFPGP
jgi:CubicO group peptidase (beta-lactamase class C family)